MPYYENVFIVRQDISASAVDGLVERLIGVIQENGGQVTKKEYWGLRSLAYRIRKNRKGHYVLMNIDAPVAAVQEMERQMRINEDVLRFLTLRVDELEEGPSAMMRARSSRDERGRRDERGHYRGGHARERERPGAAAAKSATAMEEGGAAAAAAASPAAGEPEAGGETAAPAPSQAPSPAETQTPTATEAETKEAKTTESKTAEAESEGAKE